MNFPSILSKVGENTPHLLASTTQTRPQPGGLTLSSLSVSSTGFPNPSQAKEPLFIGTGDSGLRTTCLRWGFCWSCAVLDSCNHTTARAEAEKGLKLGPVVA